MRSYAKALAQLSFAVLMLFALASWLGFERWLGDPLRWLQALGPWAGVVSVLLLWLDVLLPIPSSLCMIANGALFGAFGGAMLSLLGGVGSTLIAHELGKRYQSFMMREMNEQNKADSHLYLTKWGPFAIVLTRPVPILAESVAVLSGTLPFSLIQISAYAALGHLAPCVIYAQTGVALVSR